MEPPRDAAIAAVLRKISHQVICTLRWLGYLEAGIDAAVATESAITHILRHCKLASVPPLIAPTRSRQETFDWIVSAHDIARGLVSAVRVVERCLTLLSV